MFSIILSKLTGGVSAEFDVMAPNVGTMHIIKFKSNDLRIQIFVFEKPYIVYMCIVDIHEMKQGQNQNKRGPTTSDKTCCDTLQKYLFFSLTLTKMLTVAN